MSSSISDYWYEWPTWEVYPRVHYFYKRYTDLLTRFKRLSGFLPKCFQDNVLISKLDQIRKHFEKGVKLHVIGKEIDINDLDVSAAEKHDAAEPPTAHANICHTSIQNLDLEGLEDIHILAQKLTEDISDELIDEPVNFMSCGIENSYSKENVYEFRQAVITTVQDNGLSIKPENILLGSDVNSLNTKISDEFEKKLTVGFRRIYACLQNLDLDDRETVQDSDILENESVVTSIIEFFRNPYTFREIHFEIKSATGEKDNDEFIEHVISRLSRVVKCAAVSPLAKKHHLKVWICNELLHEIMFEEAVRKALSNTVRHHFKKLEYVAEPTDNQKCYKFDFLLYQIQDDMRPLFVKTEAKLTSMKRLSMTIRRLFSETRGYLKQSKVMEENRLQRENHSMKVSESLRRDILNIEEVYGMGTFYGKLEIHLDKTNPQHKNVEAGTTEEIQDPKSEVEKQMQKHNFHFPYAVRYVQSKPEKMNGSFEPGDMLHCQTKSKGVFNKGTLGTFLNSRDGKLYGLTCAHVVAGTRRVFVQREGRVPLSVCCHTVQTSQDECRLIDIAALEVIPSLQKNCKSSLENNAGRVAKAELENEPPEALVDRYVHKFGAETGLTQGTIMTVDYSTFGPKAEDYVVIVDPLAANNSKELEDLADAFGSLLEVSPQDGGGQQNEGTETQIITNEETSGGTSTGQSNSLSDEENVNPKRRKLEVEDTVSQYQVTTGTSNVQESDVNMGDVNHASEDTNEVLEAGVSVLCPCEANIDKGTETSNHINAKQPEKTTCCTNAILYVRHIKESEIEQCQQKESGIFGVEGDSGSAICTRNLSKEGPKYFALAMLSAGDFEIEGQSGKKALSFMLKDGLTKLYEHCQVEF